MRDENLKVQIFERAKKEKWAIGQFNVCNMEVLRAVMQAAQKLKSPVIIGTSEGESRFIGLSQAVSLVSAWRAETGLPVFLNLDHGRDFGYIKEAVAVGYDCVHFDGSKLLFKENIDLTKQIVKIASVKNVTVEGEIDNIKGTSIMLNEAPEILQEDLTDVDRAKEFLKETGVNLLAVNIGSFHGVSRDRSAETIDVEKLIALNSNLNTFLVMHGGSGLSDDSIRSAISNGIVKINTNTELRIAYAESLREILNSNPDEVVPYKYLPGVISNVQSVVEEKIKLFGSANKA